MSPDDHDAYQDSDAAGGADEPEEQLVPTEPHDHPPEQFEDEDVRWMPSDEAGKGPPAAEAMIPPPETPDQLGPCQSSRGSGGLGVLLAVLAIAVVAAGAAAAKFYWDLAGAHRALVSTATTLASLSDATQQRAKLDAVVKQVEGRRYEQAARGLQELAGEIARGRRGLGAMVPGAGMGAPGQGRLFGPSGPGAQEMEAQVPPEAQKFFQSRPELLGRLLALTQAAREMRDGGVDVDQMRKARDQILQAAVRGDENTVRRLIEQFEQAVRAEGGRLPQRERGGRARGGRGGRSPGARGGGPRIPAGAGEKVEEFRKAVEKAMREGRDVRAAMALARQAEQAAVGGNMKQAEELLNKALSALQNAPRGRPPARGRLGAQRGRLGQHERPGRPAMAPGLMPEGGPMNILQMLFNMVRAEDIDLAATYKSLENAFVALREKNQDQIREILSSGKEAMQRISDRRKKVASMIRSPESRPANRPQARQRQRPGSAPENLPQQAPLARKPLPERLVDFLRQVRKMPEQEFEANAGRLAQVLFSMFMPPKPEGGGLEMDEAAADRVRQKLRLAAGPLAQSQVAGEDTSSIDEVFSQARAALYRGDTEQAEKLVDEGLRMLGLLEAPGVTVPKTEDETPAPAANLPSLGE